MIKYLRILVGVNLFRLSIHIMGAKTFNRVWNEVNRRIYDGS